VNSITALEGLLSGTGNRQRRGRRGEGGAKGIPFQPEDVAAVSFDSATKGGVVARKGLPHGSLVLLPTPGTALDISEEKGHSSTGQRFHSRSPCQPPAWPGGGRVLYASVSLALSCPASPSWGRVQNLAEDDQCQEEQDGDQLGAG
jgi:hypothetical protein